MLIISCRITQSAALVFKMNVTCITTHRMVYSPSSASISGSNSTSCWVFSSSLNESSRGRAVCKYVDQADKLTISKGWCPEVLPVGGGWCVGHRLSRLCRPLSVSMGCSVSNHSNPVAQVRVRIGTGTERFQPFLPHEHPDYCHLASFTTKNPWIQPDNIGCN
jgi:hypothetical protein